MEKEEAETGTRFTCFTGTKVQILTVRWRERRGRWSCEKEKREGRAGCVRGQGGGTGSRLRYSLALLVQKYLLTSTKVQILTPEERWLAFTSSKVQIRTHSLVQKYRY